MPKEGFEKIGSIPGFNQSVLSKERLKAIEKRYESKDPISDAELQQDSSQRRQMRGFLAYGTFWYLVGWSASVLTLVAFLDLDYMVLNSVTQQSAS